jgi:hypothetical protein
MKNVFAAPVRLQVTKCTPPPQGLNELSRSPPLAASSLVAETPGLDPTR